MTEEAKKPIILHVEDKPNMQQVFRQVITKLAEIKNVDAELLLSHVVQVDTASAATSFIENNISNINAIYTDNTLQGRKKGAQIMAVAKEVAESHQLPVPKRFWVSSASPTQEEYAAGDFTVDSVLSKDLLHQMQYSSTEALSKKINTDALLNSFLEPLSKIADQLQPSLEPQQKPILGEATQALIEQPNHQTKDGKIR